MKQSSRLPPLSSLRAFEAVARRASFKAAAAELSVTASAVSHQIRQLETHVGVRLLDRTTRSTTLTGAGKVLQEATSAGFDTIREAISKIGKAPATSELTLTTTAAFLSHWLAPRLASLQSALSPATIRFHVSDDVEELDAARIDVAIRYGRGPFQGAECHKLCDDELITVCSPALRLSGNNDLSHATLIHIDGRNSPAPTPDWKRWCDEAGLSDVDAHAGPHLPDSMSAVQAAIAGQGVVLVSRLLVSDALASNLLVQPSKFALKGDAYHFAIALEVTEEPNVGILRDWFARHCQSFLTFQSQRTLRDHTG